MNKSAFMCVILCGVLVACLPRLVAPSDSYISDSLNPVVTDNTFDLFPPFQPVYINSNDFRFNISVPLNRASYSFSWSYSQLGSNFKTVDSSDNLFTTLSNSLRVRSSANIRSFYISNCFYFKCDVYETGTSNLLHTYYFSYQFFDFPLLQNNSSRSALRAVESIDVLQEEQPQEEQPQEEQPQEEQLQEEQPQEQLQEEQPQEQLQEEPQEEIEGGEDGE